MKSAAYRDTVMKAISQIERSDAQRGLVFVSLSSLLDHDLFMPAHEGGRSGMSKQRMLTVLEGENERLYTESMTLSDVELTNAFANMKAMPGVVHYLGTRYLTGSPDAPVPMAVQASWSRGKTNEFADLFQAGLNSTSSSYVRAKKRKLGRRRKRQ
jgi:hypothetical protein